MKNDAYKISDVTLEMKVNDLVFSIMNKELDQLVEYVDENQSFIKFGDVKEKAYFYQRVISVYSGYDVPFKAAIGLLNSKKPLNDLFNHKYDYIGDSDMSEDIFKFLVEYGFVLYDAVAEPGIAPEDVLREVIENMI